MIRFNEEDISQVRSIIHKQDQTAAIELLQDLHPADIAELYQTLDLEEAEYIFMLLSPEIAADVLDEALTSFTARADCATRDPKHGLG